MNISPKTWFSAKTTPLGELPETTQVPNTKVGSPLGIHPPSAGGRRHGQPGRSPNGGDDQSELIKSQLG